MEKRTLGKTDLQIAPVVFGGNVFGWTADKQTSFDLLDKFIGSGFNGIDTADVYSRWAAGNSGGESEAIIGQWVKERKNRHEVVVMTKVGSDMGDGKKGLRKDYIIRAAEDSLKRLQTDYIDLYQTHFDEETTPVEEMLEAYARLIKDGKVRWVGTSNMSVERIRESIRAHNEKGLPKYQTLQPHYNLYAREWYETNYEPLAFRYDLGVITYYSLESGFLTGKYRTADDISKSPRGGKMQNYFNGRGTKILNALELVSQQYHTTPAAVALAWLIQRPSVTAPIVSATQVQQLDSMIQAPLLKLDPGAIGLLDAASEWK